MLNTEGHPPRFPINPAATPPACGPLAPATGGATALPPPASPGSASRAAAPPAPSAPSVAVARKSSTPRHGLRQSVPTTPAGSLPFGRAPPISSDANRPSTPSPSCFFIAQESPPHYIHLREKCSSPLQNSKIRNALLLSSGAC